MVVGVACCSRICMAEIALGGSAIRRDLHHGLQQIEFADGKDLQRSVGRLPNFVVMDVSSAYLSLGWSRLPSSGDNDPPFAGYAQGQG